MCQVIESQCLSCMNVCVSIQDERKTESTSEKDKECKLKRRNGREVQGVVEREKLRTSKRKQGVRGREK